MRFLILPGLIFCLFVRLAFLRILAEFHQKDQILLQTSVRTKCSHTDLRIIPLFFRLLVNSSLLKRHISPFQPEFIKRHRKSTICELQRIYFHSRDICSTVQGCIAVKKVGTQRPLISLLRKISIPTCKKHLISDTSSVTISSLIKLYQKRVCIFRNCHFKHSVCIVYRPHHAFTGNRGGSLLCDNTQCCTICCTYSSCQLWFMKRLLFLVCTF